MTAPSSKRIYQLDGVCVLVLVAAVSWRLAEWLEAFSDWLLIYFGTFGLLGASLAWLGWWRLWPWLTGATEEKYLRLPLLLATAAGVIGFLVPDTAANLKNPLGIEKYRLLAVWLAACAGGALALVLVLRDRVRAGDRPPARLLAAAAFLFYLAALPAVSLHTIHGDEPDYLWMAQSLIADGDLDVGNQVSERVRDRLVPRPFPDGSLRYYTLFQPAYSIILIPFVQLCGVTGALFGELLIATLLAVQLHRLLEDFYPDRRDAVFWGWLAAVFTAPLATFATHLYPESLAALLVVVAVRRLVAPRTPAAALTVGMLIAFLPWLHYRYAYLAAVLGAFLVVAYRREWRRLATPAVLVGGSAVLLLVYRGAAAVPAAADPRLILNLTSLPSQFLRFFLDQEYGLWFIAPVCLLLPAALAIFPRRGFAPWLVLALLASFGAFHSLFAIWGIGALAGRYLTPVMPLVAVVMTALAARVPRGPVAWLLLALVAAGIGLALLQGFAPVFRYEHANGRNLLLQTVSPALPPWFPSLVRVGTMSSRPLDAVGGCWLAAALALNLAVALAVRPVDGRARGGVQ